MSLVENGRCVKCKKVLNISLLEENKNALGKVCIDKETCKERIKNAKQRQ